MTGASPHGQGEETTFAQIAADELGVPIDDIMVLHGDTAIVQYGIGTFGSRGTAVGGPALYFALQELKKKIVKFGEMLLESSDVTLSGGQCVDNRTGKSVSLAQIAGASYRAMKLPPNTEPGMIATYFWEPPNFAFPFGAHIVITEVDRETGKVVEPGSSGRSGMIPQNFEYSAPNNLKEALALLAGGNAKVLAGGMSLIPLMKLRLAAPDHLVDLSRVPDLKSIREDAGTIH